jgi:NAD(P)-dependent dehydrogenase (short-subunit alcohol dehydrogenase family)
MRLQNKTALITGGTSGIGAAAVQRFAAEGARVAFTGRRREAGAALAQAITQTGGSAVYLYADHRSPADCERVVAEVLAAFGRLDILFNNAGVVPAGTAEQTSEDEWADTFALNVTAVWRMSRLVLPAMRAQGGGVIINNASDWGLVAGREAVAYCASKGAVVQLTRAMALDHAREGLRINAVCPGDTFVERWRAEGYARNALAQPDDALLAELGAALPIGRVGRAAEIASAVLFLASDDSAFMTGATLVVDGGNTAA